MVPDKSNTEEITRPGYRIAYNINPALVATNRTDEDGNPSSGHVELYVTKHGDPDFPAISIDWQDGGRATGETNPDGSPVLAAPNGAFIEDVLWAALQRLEFFQDSKYRDRGNALAITHIEGAIQALKDRQLERSHRNVEGRHEV